MVQAHIDENTSVYLSSKLESQIRWIENGVKGLREDAADVSNKDTLLNFLMRREA